MAWKELKDGVYKVTDKPVTVLNRKNYKWIKRVIYFQSGWGMFILLNNKKVRVVYNHNIPNAKAHTL